MLDKVVIDKTISPTWNTIAQIVDQVEESMAGSDKNLIDSTTIVLTELIENAVKYGESIPGKTDSSISLHLEIDDHIKIITSNYVTNKANLFKVTDHIDKINQTNDPEALYIERLTELMNESKFEESQLGLYRISYEGKFKLNYKYEEDKLTIIATKKIN